METLARREAPAQREVWSRKILELREDGARLRRQGEHHDRTAGAGTRQRREREELLRRRRRNRGDGGGGDGSDLRNLTEEADSLASSRGMVNELLDAGQASYNGLVGQRQRMRWVSFSRGIVFQGNAAKWRHRRVGGVGGHGVASSLYLGKGFGFAAAPLVGNPSRLGCPSRKRAMPSRCRGLKQIEKG